MLADRRHRQHRSLLEAPRITTMLKKTSSGTLSPDTTTTTSSGYSTGGSSVTNTKDLYLKKSSSVAYKPSSHQEQQKTKSKGLHHLFSKLKTILLPSKSKQTHSRPMRTIASRQISSTNILRQYHQHGTTYDKLPPSLTTSNTVSLPFTYYQDSPIRQSRGNFEKISAWLDHTEKLTKHEQERNNELLINTRRPKSISSLSKGMNDQAVTVAMKNTRTHIRPPKRSSSLVTRIIRPIIEQQQPQQPSRAISPASSFSSSILTRGMSERLSPVSPTPRNHDKYSTKSHRHRTIDFSRRRTIATTNERQSNKENFPMKHDENVRQDVYRFSPLSEKSQIDIKLPTKKHTVTKQYYFHPCPAEPDDDLLNNSYGLTLLRQQEQQSQPAKQHHSVSTVLLRPRTPNYVSLPPAPSVPPISQISARSFIDQDYTFGSLDDLLCDREVESYFFPATESEHFYMNLVNSSSLYQPTISYVHETLC